MHLFVAPNSFKTASFKETVAYEFTHPAYYEAHPAENYSLREHVVINGIAEAFREEVFGGVAAPCPPQFQGLLLQMLSKIWHRVLIRMRNLYAKKYYLAIQNITAGLDILSGIGWCVVIVQHIQNYLGET